MVTGGNGYKHAGTNQLVDGGEAMVTVSIFACFKSYLGFCRHD